MSTQTVYLTKYDATTLTATEPSMALPAPSIEAVMPMFTGVPVFKKCRRFTILDFGNGQRAMLTYYRMV
jgi:hypothetical protein